MGTKGYFDPQINWNKMLFFRNIDPWGRGGGYPGEKSMKKA